jgi:hypothetical protein
VVVANAVQGPIHPTLGIAMDMSIQLKSASGAICTLSLSFNNEGPLGTFFRYICDNGTYIARYDDLYNGKDEKIDVSKVDVSMNGIELQDREFFAAIRAGREPNASVASVLDCYRRCTSSNRNSRARRPIGRPGDFTRMTQQLEARVAELEHQLGVQQDIHAIRRLQYAYGYFIDKSQYDEVVDLFAESGEVWFHGGIWRGKAGVRRLYIERFASTSPKTTMARATAGCSIIRRCR